MTLDTNVIKDVITAPIELYIAATESKQPNLAEIAPGFVGTAVDFIADVGSASTATYTTLAKDKYQKLGRTGSDVYAADGVSLTADTSTTPVYSMAGTDPIDELVQTHRNQLTLQIYDFRIDTWARLHNYDAATTSATGTNQSEYSLAREPMTNECSMLAVYTSHQYYMGGIAAFWMPRVVLSTEGLPSFAIGTASMVEATFTTLRPRDANLKSIYLLQKTAA